jgi:site-specific recombinase XerC
VFFDDTQGLATTSPDSPISTPLRHEKAAREIPEKVHPHMLRHSRAMHLY